MKPLFITAHYDDLEVSAGGTAARYGGLSTVLTPQPTHGTLFEAERSAEILGIGLTSIHDVDGLTRLAEEFDTIISVSPWDSHPHHQAAASVARQVARKNRQSLWFMDHAIPGGYTASPRPNHFVDIYDYTLTKYDAINCYDVLRDEVEGIQARDRYYGVIFGRIAAEGFIVEHTIT